MNKGFYQKLALTNIKKNKQTYFPYMLTCICTIMMYYIVHSISINGGLNHNTLKEMLSFGIIVIGMFSAIFLFYTNSFLIRRRKKELGLYNILGMEKKHIAKVMLYEILFIAIISLTLGLLGGIILSKLMFLILLKILNFDVSIEFDISISSILITLIVFITIFFMTLMFNFAQIHAANAIDLLKGGEYGEKEPKTKWFLTSIGLITLGIGYGIALVIDKPVDAIGVFFIAVILVIIGTYSLFIAGSIVLLKMLKNNKKFYYTTKNFTAVSGMIYRMKQNASGLASICILSTAVLVILSATTSLYMGQEDILKSRFQNDISIVCNKTSNETSNLIDNIVETQAKNYNIKINDAIKFNYINFITSRDKDTFYLEDKNTFYTVLNIMSIDEYNKIENKSEWLNNDEILIYSTGKNYGQNTFNILDRQFKVKNELDNFKVYGKSLEVAIDTYYIILNDLNSFYNRIYEIYSNDEVEIEALKKYSFNFNFNGDETAKINFVNTIQQNIKNEVEYTRVYSLNQSKQDFLSTYGGLFFIGILFGILFLMATVLIIYYKQISEGFEDKERFEIMQKVGMTKKEIKNSIQSQIIIVFFLPLTVAIIHTIVAFKVIRKLLLLFNFGNTILFIICTSITIFIFAIIYFTVYLFTAKVYYKIIK